MTVKTDTEVKLLVGGIELTRWKSYEVEADMMTPADAFHFVAANVDGALAGVIQPEDEVRVLVDGELVCTGAVDDVSYDVGDGGATVEITGRDRGRFLVDCSAKPCSLKGQTLKTLAERLAGDWVPVWTTSGVAVLPQVKRMKIDPGESVLDALNRFAAPAKAMVWLDEKGQGVIGKPNYHQKPLYSLYRYKGSNDLRAKNNILRGRVTVSSRERFSSVTVLSSMSNPGGGLFGGGGGGSLFGGGASKLKGTAVDPAVRKKPKVISGQAASTAQARILAEEEVQKGQFEGWKAEYTVRGHKNSDELWRVNTLCTLVDELAAVDGGTYFVTRRRFHGGEESRFTDVELRLKDVFLG